MRSSLVTSELLLVRALGFDLEIELPFAYCLNVLRGLGSVRYFVTDETRKHGKKHHHHLSQKEVWKRMENGMRHTRRTRRRRTASLTLAFFWYRYRSRDKYNSKISVGVCLGQVKFD